MSIDEMKEYLIGIQKELPQTKILNALLAQQEQIEVLRTALIETQGKVNEIINALNSAAPAEEEDTSEEETVAIEN